jgi:hypothetical protein
MGLISKGILVGLLCFVSLSAQADWQCYTVDQGGHYWRSVGMTQERAIAVAMNFCTAHSPHGSSCEVSKCFENGNKVPS